jgi:hypothetical protein
MGIGLATVMSILVLVELDASVVRNAISVDVVYGDEGSQPAGTLLFARLSYRGGMGLPESIGLNCRRRVLFADELISVEDDHIGLAQFPEFVWHGQDYLLGTSGHLQRQRLRNSDQLAQPRSDWISGESIRESRREAWGLRKGESRSFMISLSRFAAPHWYSCDLRARKAAIERRTVRFRVPVSVESLFEMHRINLLLFGPVILDNKSFALYPVPYVFIDVESQIRAGHHLK